MNKINMDVNVIPCPYDKNPPPFCYPGTSLKKYEKDLSLIASQILPKQLNVIGLHTHCPVGEGGFDQVQDIERKAIKWITQLLDGDPDKIDGHFCSGGTSANIEGMWIGKKYLKSLDDNSDILVIISPTAHYSFGKACDILDLTYIKKTGINPRFEMDLMSLDEIIRNADTRNIIIIATASTVSTGAIDPIKGICEIIQKYKKKNIYLHIDACFGGFVIPFINKSDLTQGFSNIGFQYSQVMSIAVDGHKMGLLPYPSGVVLMKSELKHLIATTVDYIGGHSDGTLEGSRNGFTPIYANYFFEKYGFKEYQKQAELCIRSRNHLKHLIEERKIPGVKILPYDSATNFLPLEIQAKEDWLQQHEKLKDYELRFVHFESKEASVIIKECNFLQIAKICIMPHTFPFLKRFVDDLEEAMKTSKLNENKYEIKEEMVVDPWKVSGSIDYFRLIEKFGTEIIDTSLKERLTSVLAKNNTHFCLHPWIRRNIFFSHRAFHVFLDKYEQGLPVFLYTGRGPTSEAMHLGHAIPFIFTKWLQEVFHCPLVVQISDDEKFYFKDKSFKEIYDMGKENIKDIIAFGFDPNLTYIFSNREHRLQNPQYEELVSEMKKQISTRQVANIFGFDKGGKPSNVGMYDWPFYQCAAAFSQAYPHLFGSIKEKTNKKAFCLVPYAIDQDPYFRMARDLADAMNLEKPCSIMSSFLPPLTGLGGGKMSSSVGMESTIFLTDTPEIIEKKIMKYAFSGGQDTKIEHRRLGGNVSVDIACQYLNFFEYDDDKLKELYQGFASGKILSGEIKKEMSKRIIEFVVNHQKRRNEITPEIIRTFCKSLNPID